jgi:hypothetical protein
LDDTALNSNTVPAAPGAAAPPSTQDTITKTRDIVRIVRLDANKKPWTIWCHGPQEIMIWPDGKSCAQLTPALKHFDPNPFMIDFSTSDFSGFDWIALKYYTGLKSYGGRNCIVYQTQISSQDDSGDPPTSLTQIAYVDFTSRLPVGLQSGNDVYLYKWNTSPQDMLSYPPMVQAVINAGLKAQRQMSQKAVSSY